MHCIVTSTSVLLRLLQHHLQRPMGIVDSAGGPVVECRYDAGFRQRQCRNHFNLGTWGLGAWAFRPVVAVVVLKMVFAIIKPVGDEIITGGIREK